MSSISPSASGIVSQVQTPPGSAPGDLPQPGKVISDIIGGSLRGLDLASQLVGDLVGGLVPDAAQVPFLAMQAADAVGVVA